MNLWLRLSIISDILAAVASLLQFHVNSARPLIDISLNETSHWLNKQEHLAKDSLQMVISMKKLVKLVQLVAFYSRGIFVDSNKARISEQCWKLSSSWDTKDTTWTFLRFVLRLLFHDQFFEALWSARDRIVSKENRSRNMNLKNTDT